jgi:hypothetical protein
MRNAVRSQHEQEMCILPFLLVILIIFFIGLTEYRDIQRLRLYKENYEKEKSPIRMMSEQEERSSLAFKITLAFQQELDGHRAQLKNEVDSARKTKKAEHEPHAQLQNEDESVTRMLNVEHEPHAQLQNVEESVMRMLNVELEPHAQLQNEDDSEMRFNMEFEHYAQFLKETDSDEKIIEVVDSLISEIQEAINAM